MDEAHIEINKPSDEHRFIQHLLDETSRTGKSYLWVWNPLKQLALSPSSLNRNGVSEAIKHAERKGFPAVERITGGGPVPHNGRTVSFVYTDRIDNTDIGLNDRYREITSNLSDLLGSLDISVSCGESMGEFCPGQYSIHAEGKIAGVAQRLKRNSALTSGVVVIEYNEGYRELTKSVYEYIGLDFRDETMDSVSNYIDTDVDVFSKELFRHLIESLSVDSGLYQDPIINGKSGKTRFGNP